MMVNRERDTVTQTSVAESAGAQCAVTSTQADASPRGPLPRFRAGERFGDFLILRELGHGGFATVYLALDVPLERRVALKVSEIRGLGEGRVLAELEHEHIVQVYAQFTHGETGKHCLCLQFVPGTTLAKVIERLHRKGHSPQQGIEILQAIGLDAREEVLFDPAGLRNMEVLAHCGFAPAVCQIGRQLAEALHFAHRRGVLHCDIKPANVLMNPFGRPLLADFNVSVEYDESRPSKSVGGTIVYMSPEQLAFHLRERDQRVDERSDIYSLGVLLFELLTGRLPFEATGAETERDLLRRRRAFDPTVPWEQERISPVLERILRRCLDPQPANRYPDAGELARALGNGSELLNIDSRLPIGDRLTRWAEKWPVLMLVALTLLPHLVATVVNIAYNLIEILLEASQKIAFARVILGYNLIVYPLAITLMLRRVAPVIRGWRKIAISGAMKGAEIDSIRRDSLRLASWGMILALAGWLPGGLIFPLAIDLQAGGMTASVYAHFMLSFTLSGLIALIYSYFGIQFVVLRIIYPRLGNADTYSKENSRTELSGVGRWFALLQILAGAVPLVGAVLLVAVTGEMTLSFRILMTSLIVLGMAGVGIVVALTRRLSQTVRLLEGDLVHGTAPSR